MFNIYLVLYLKVTIENRLTSNDIRPFPAHLLVETLRVYLIIEVLLNKAKVCHSSQIQTLIYIKFWDQMFFRMTQISLILHWEKFMAGARTLWRDPERGRDPLGKGRGIGISWKPWTTVLAVNLCNLHHLQQQQQQCLQTTRTIRMLTFCWKVSWRYGAEFQCFIWRAIVGLISFTESLLVVMKLC